MNLLRRAAHRLATWTKGPCEGGWRQMSPNKILMKAIQLWERNDAFTSCGKIIKTPLDKQTLLRMTCCYVEWRRKGSSTSFPRGIPLPRAQVRPMTLATKVLKVRYSLRTTPLSIVFISGMPEPEVGREKEKERKKCQVGWWSAEKIWVERKQLQRGGIRWRNEEHRNGREGSWLIFIQFCVCTSHQRYILWLSCL